MKLTNKQYDILKWVALIAIPATATLILTVGKIWGLQYYDNIAATVTALGLFLAALIGVSTSAFNAAANKNDFAEALKENGIEILDSEKVDGIGGSYTPRLSEPSRNDKNWIHTSYGGYNSCILITGNSCLPNCVGYAWGRWRQLLGKAPKLSRGNAENWWSYNDGYKRGSKPVLGAVACWRKGRAGYEGDGAGHVGIVEKIDADGTVTIGQSGYGYKRFYITKFKKGNMNLGGSYVFQGFIYLPNTAPKTTTTNKTTAKKITYKVVCKEGMNVRAKATTNSKRIGVLGYGKKFVSSKQSGNWAYCDSMKGWVCIKEGRETYLTKG